MPRDYFVGPIAFVLFALYGFSYALMKRGKITLAGHRKVWNVFLLLSFLVNATFGTLAALKASYGIVTITSFNYFFWHVEAGIAMAIVGLFHVLWHWSYFESILKKK